MPANTVVGDKKSTENSTDIVVRAFEGEKNNSLLTPIVGLLFTGLILLGIGSGYFLSLMVGSPTSTGKASISLGGDNVKKGEAIGSDDLETFKDTAEGELKEGGIDGEGEYHLERPGGPSQFVYLTSSVLDLSEYVNKKIKVWGKTEQAKKAGWLMDVGRLQVL